MDKKYEEIDFGCGRNIESCVLELLEYKEKGELAYGVFNGHELYSDTVTLDNAYIEITGTTKEKLDNHLKKLNEEYEKQKQEHIDSIPAKSRHWMTKGRKILNEDKWKHWDAIVPIRLHDLYQGMELECCLNIVEILNKGTIEEAKTEIEKQGHSGMSFSLVCSMVREFSPRGEEFFKIVK